ncbi:uncharacterized protein IUM83_08034 [Phytophthora cinnamomi]|uniref:uncharacterized protein n=1 Tax=Phytophthora cinnamomi TaxID=4785 RepID=UPI0035597DDC|nr:hypothetical protein IUM83_08034 [Phytophthora cinnamomi]
MRKLPSSASAGNLRQLVGSAVVSSNASLYSSNGSSPPNDAVMDAPRRHGAHLNVAMSGLIMATQQQLGSADVEGVAASGEDRASKKSLAYLHTKFHRLLRDKFGKSYERRICKHCDVIFSFRGGTTSAALRHLKKAHPEKLADNGDDEEQQGDNSQVAEGTEDQAWDSSSASGRGPDEASNENAIGVENVASADDPDDDDSSFTVETETPTSASPTTSLKRKRDDGDYSESRFTSAPVSGDIHAGRANGASSPQLTASQTAIVHFLERYFNELPQPAMRLRFAKHLTHNVGEAEMYNVLDPATQLEYVREFSRST